MQNSIIEARSSRYLLEDSGPGIPGDGTADNHSPLATFDDSVVPDGAAVLAELALRSGRTRRTL